MASKYHEFDRSRLDIQPLAERIHDLTLEHWLDLESPVPPFDDPRLSGIAQKFRTAAASNAFAPRP